MPSNSVHTKRWGRHVRLGVAQATEKREIEVFNQNNSFIMDKMDLKKYGITGVTEIVYNPSYDELFREETKKGLRGYEKGQLTDMGAVNVIRIAKAFAWVMEGK